MLCLNPTSTNLIIEMDEQIETVSIFNIRGSMVQQENEAAFSIEGLASGIYVINVTTVSGLQQTRFVKE